MTLTLTASYGCTKTMRSVKLNGEWVRMPVYKRVGSCVMAEDTPQRAALAARVYGQYADAYFGMQPELALLDDCVIVPGRYRYDHGDEPPLVARVERRGRRLYAV